MLILVHLKCSKNLDNILFFDSLLINNIFNPPILLAIPDPIIKKLIRLEGYSKVKKQLVEIVSITTPDNIFFHYLKYLKNMIYLFYYRFLNTIFF